MGPDAQKPQWEAAESSQPREGPQGLLSLTTPLPAPQDICSLSMSALLTAAPEVTQEGPISEQAVIPFSSSQFLFMSEAMAFIF